ncbi:MAG TPA: TIGR03435 family protein [Bryobacteraceae bacterium]|jgi:uncharacterized protein (TIGR03435 family)
MLLRVAVYAVLFLAVGLAQAPTAQSEGPRFEVVAIRPTPTPAGNEIHFNVNAARVDIRNYSLFGLLTRAFRIDWTQLVAPAYSGAFDIQATLPAGATPEQVPEMLLTMLVERFKLAYHRETRQYTVNVLTIGKSGMKLPRLPDGTPVATKHPGETLPDGTTRVTMTGKLASVYPAMYSGGLQIVDETGLDGIYTWVQMIPPFTPDMPPQAAFQYSFKAMFEDAGLKLETRKVPKETIVVDHLEKMPTKN